VIPLPTVYEQLVYGAYGWILSSDSGERLVCGMGPARGYKPTPYRAEGVGMLSLLRFLIRLAEFTCKFDQWHGIIATDSKSLLDTLFGTALSAQDCQAIKTLQSTDALQADWDVVVEIHRALAVLPGITLRHIKGHQDRKTRYDNLTLLAQLNVDVDHLAGEYQQQHGRARPQVLMSPHARAHFVQNDVTITSNFSVSLRHHASSAPLMTYMQKRHNWTQATINAVNWEAHGNSLRRELKHRTHLIKLVHNILPTNAHIHRRDPFRCICPSCNREKEDWVHVLRCTERSRSIWRGSLLTDLHSFCVTEHTCPKLQNLLLDALRSWLRAPPTIEFTVDPIFYSSTLTRLIHQQNRIGWGELFRGRFSKEWARVQDDIYWQQADTLPTSKMTGLRWQVKLIRRIWEKWYSLWKMRNQAIHGHDLSTRQAAERRETFRSLDEIYNARHHFEPSVQGLLLPSVADHRQVPLWVTRNWLSSHQRIFHDSAQRVRKAAIQGVRSIRTYFHSMPP
jgi:hypothetical protein